MEELRRDLFFLGAEPGGGEPGDLRGGVKVRIPDRERGGLRMERAIGRFRQ